MKGHMGEEWCVDEGRGRLVRSGTGKRGGPVYIPANGSALVGNTTGFSGRGLEVGAKRCDIH